MNTAVTTKMIGSAKIQPSWHLSFCIPARNSFSSSVQSSIDTGVVTARSRREIVQTLRTLMLQHTRYPSSEQYNEVCRRLVGLFPNLKDSIGSGYVSYVLDSYILCLGANLLALPAKLIFNHANILSYC